MEVQIFGRGLAEFGGRRGFEPEIHFHPHRTGERVDDADDLQPARFSEIALGQARGEIHVGEVAAEAPLDTGPQNFDGDLTLAFGIDGAGAVHLCDRGGGDRLAELAEHEPERHPESGLDRCHRSLPRERLHAVLQRFQRAGDLRTHDVRTRRQELPELHIGRAKTGDRNRDAFHAVALTATVDQPSASGHRAGGGAEPLRISMWGTTGIRWSWSRSSC